MYHARRLGGCGKTRSAEETTPSGAKARLISRGLRGPEGPLFHGKAHILKFSATCSRSGSLLFALAG